MGISDTLKKLADIRALINEIYEDETDVNILKSRDCFREYCTDIEKALKEGEAHKNASEILRIIFNAPFIIETLFNKKELGKSATDRYLWGTISNEEVQKIKEFFKDGKI